MTHFIMCEEKRVSEETYVIKVRYILPSRFYALLEQMVAMIRYQSRWLFECVVQTPEIFNCVEVQNICYAGAVNVLRFLFHSPQHGWALVN